MNPVDPAPSPHRRHSLATFELALEELRNHTLMMAALALRNLRNAIKGFSERRQEECNVVIADDEEVDVLEKELDQLAMRTILHFQPVAVDLRATLAAPKLGAHLEKLADVAVSIAKRGRKLNQEEPLTEAAFLLPLAQDTVALVTDAVRAYEHGLPELASGLQERHRELRRAAKRLGEELAEAMSSSPHRVEAYLHLIFIARFLETAAALGRAIGEDSYFITEALDIRHPRATKFTE